MDRVLANLKTLSIDMIDNASSGHPGIALSSAPIIYTLYANHMYVNPKDPKWLNRDRFVLSAGHGSALLYACLYMVGFLTLKDLKQFRTIKSVTPGHPEYGLTNGVEATTGPLGQGIATAVGMAMAEKHLQTLTKNKFDYYTYVLCGDGDLMEGISYEACSLAGTLKLSNLIILYDSNNVSLDGNIDLTFTEDVRERFDAMGWYTTLVTDGNKTKDIDKAIRRAKKSGLPSLIEIKTVLGEGSLDEGSNKVHGKPLSRNDIINLHKKLSIPYEPFYVDEEAVKEFRQKIINRTSEKYINWNENYQNMNLCSEFELMDIYKTEKIPVLEPLTESNAKILNYIANKTNLLFGGSADVFSSTKVYLNNKGNFSSLNYAGKNIYFGVREHAMGAILNGIALSGFLPFGSTFLAFANYLYPSIRLSSLMCLPVTYIFSHDSVAIGQDGPTHQPIEQLSQLRSIPDFTVYRPADYNEIVGTWRSILKLKKPSAIILSKLTVPTLLESNPYKVEKGAYIIKKERGNVDLILLSSGYEVNTCINIANKLENYNVRVVSMPSSSLFLKTSKEYQRQILPIGVKTIVVEAAYADDLRRFVSNDKYLITLNKFGISGTPLEVLDFMDFTEEQITARILELL